MNEFQQRVRTIFDRYLERHPNERYALQDDRYGPRFTVMLNWICNTYRMHHTSHSYEWSQVHQGVREAVNEFADALVGEKGGT